MKIAFGSDPNATEFKKVLMEHTKKLGHEVYDLGSDDPIYANVAIACGEPCGAAELSGERAASCASV